MREDVPGAGLGGSHDEREQTLNQIQEKRDGIDTDTNVIVMAGYQPGPITSIRQPSAPDFRPTGGLRSADIKGEKDFRVHVAASRSIRCGSSIWRSQLPVRRGRYREHRQTKPHPGQHAGSRKPRMSEFQDAIETGHRRANRRSLIISDEERLVFAYHDQGTRLWPTSCPNVIR
jgi:cell division protease FtsH